MRLMHKIRLKLLKESKFAKYFVYAIGEVLIVIVGIIVAITLNNWNESRKDKVIEIETLVEIKSGFEDDLKEVRINIKSKESTLISSEIIEDCILRKVKYNDSLAFHFANAGNYTVFITRTGPYETLKSRGLDIITNDSLRLAIAKVYDIYYESLIELEKLITENIKNYNYYLISNFENIESNQYAKPINYNYILKDRKFANLLNISHNSNLFTCDYYQHVESKLEILIGHIEKEIQRLQD